MFRIFRVLPPSLLESFQFLEISKSRSLYREGRFGICKSQSLSRGRQLRIFPKSPSLYRGVDLGIFVSPRIYIVESILSYFSHNSSYFPHITLYSLIFSSFFFIFSTYFFIFPTCFFIFLHISPIISSYSFIFPPYSSIYSLIFFIFSTYFLRF